MSIELILWIVASIISIEVIFILFRKYDTNNDSWIFDKMAAILFAWIFILAQLLIVFMVDGDFVFETGNYINLLWEGLILGGLFSFFYLNKLLAKKMEGKQDE